MTSTELPVLPVKNTVLFPYLLMPLSVGRPSSRGAVEAALASEDKILVLVAQRDDAVEEPAQTDLFSMGTKAVIRKMMRTETGLELVVQGTERVRIESTRMHQGHLVALVTAVPLPTDEGTEAEAHKRAVLQQAARIEELTQGQVPPGLTQILTQANEPLQEVYLLASIVNLSLEKEQALLEVTTRADALRMIHDFLNDELQILELRNQIARQAESEMTRERRDYVLRQQLQAIQKELGEEDPQSAELRLLREKLDAAELPETVQKEVERELGRLDRLPPAAPDYQLTRSYIEFILELPWRKATEDNLDLTRAREILDHDHYDLDEVKHRIIEHLAVMKLNPTAKAPILCFVGPPGVGKTSLGESIARALGRQFERLSLGGLHDEAELRGHRRTYIGAMPGRIMQAIRRSGVRNPLLMLDEVDKLGRDFRGDPAAALIEILDPAQNASFRDNYLDQGFDLSKVFFITTANSLDTIPQPLLDRMELLRLSGYTHQEKLEIARRYLVARQLAQTGLDEAKLKFTDATLMRVIQRYTREAGVRELERTIGRVARKVAIRFVEGQTSQVEIQPTDLVELLGPERFFAEDARRDNPVGVATGLAWTEAGGDVLYIEALLLPTGEGLTLTGQLGDVMKESALAAKSYVLSHADDWRIPPDRIRGHGVHVHVPAGAVPKDGPSAGVTIATALASLYTGSPARSDTAMTGEITLTGLVLPIGGLKEKALAAHRAGIRRIIIPSENAKDLTEIPEPVRGEIEFLLARRIEDALRAAIPSLADRLPPS